MKKNSKKNFFFFCWEKKSDRREILSYYEISIGESFVLLFLFAHEEQEIIASYEQ